MDQVLPEPAQELPLVLRQHNGLLYPWEQQSLDMANEQGQADASHHSTSKARIRPRLGITLDHPEADETGEARDHKLNQRESRKIGDERRLFRTEDRLAISPAVK